MRVFVDTSALYALLDEDDTNHRAAVEAFARLQGSELVTHAYVLAETLTLISRRLGRAALERLLDALLPGVGVVAVDAPLHVAALAAHRDSAASNISFVDRTSFAFMRANRLDVAFAFDTDFSTAGFELAS
jgi:predicted nucleic acid-binding protein